jgi:hypothetical protein
MYPTTIAAIYPITIAWLCSDNGLKNGCNPGVNTKIKPINKTVTNDDTTGKEGVVLWKGNLSLRRITITAVCVNKLSKNQPVWNKF